jgi:hypothetical protein
VKGTEISKVLWLSRFQGLPLGRKKKTVKGIDTLMVFSSFSPYCCKKKKQKTKNKKKNKRGTKVYLIKSTHSCLYRGPPSGHVSPLGYFDTVAFKL